MATKEEVRSGNLVAEDKYRSFIYEEAEKVQWRHGGPPTYDGVNKLFEDGRTKVQFFLSLHLSLSLFA